MATKTDIPRKPLLFGENPFEDLRVDGMDLPDTVDASYVPGYSDVRRLNELRRVKGEPLLPQKGRAQWVRITRKSGDFVNESDEGMTEWMRLGYRACGLDDLQRLGWGMPPAATVGPDGLIRRGDAALFFVDADRADENRAIRRAELKAEAEQEMAISNPEVHEIKEERVTKRGSLEALSKEALPNLKL